MAEYNKAEREILLQTARESIRYGLKFHTPMIINLDNYSEHLQQMRASFVTLHIHSQLRGCIGSLIATQPLIINVIQNSYNAAFGDPRFSVLKLEEFEQITLDVSVLSPALAMPVSSEADLLQKLRPGVDGLILSDQGQCATFLPAVWEQLPNPKDFVTHLKIKAGWPADYWSNTMAVETYTAELIA